MLGATIGDIVGSIHAWNNIKTKKFELFDVRCRFSGATVLTCAATKALRKYVESNKQIDLQEELKEELLNYGWQYPDVNYGRNFMAWLFADGTTPVQQRRSRFCYEGFGGGLVGLFFGRGRRICQNDGRNYT